MGFRPLWRWIGILAVVGVLVGCGRGSAARPPGPVRVVVTVAPLAGLVRPLLPPDAELTALIAPGRSEHGYELTSEDVSKLAAADVVVYVGLGLDDQIASFLKRKPAATRRVVCFADAAGIQGDDHDHDHGDHDHSDHDHGTVDPHLWLDPALCERLIPAVSAAVQAAVAAQGGTGFDAAAARDRQLADIRALDEEIGAKLKPLAGRAIVTHHAAWGRFAERYGLKVAAVIRPIEGSEPTTGDVDAAVNAIREQGARAVFVEPQYSAAAAERIAKQAGVSVYELDPIGDGDWFAMMRKNAETLVRALGG